MKRIVSLVLICAPIIGAQTLSYGVKGGGFFTQPAERLDQILRLSPEVRYTRWGGYNLPATNPHQVQALLGIGF